MNEKLKTSAFEIKDSLSEPEKKTKSTIYYKGLTIEFTENFFFKKKEKESKKKETNLPK